MRSGNVAFLLLLPVQLVLYELTLTFGWVFAEQRFDTELNKTVLIPHKESVPSNVMTSSMLGARQHK